MSSAARAMVFSHSGPVFTNGSTVPVDAGAEFSFHQGESSGIAEQQGFSSVANTREWMREHGLRPGLKFAASLSILGFALEDMGLIKLLRWTSEHTPHSATARVLTDAGMIGLITLNNYVASRAVVKCVQNAAGDDANPVEMANRLTTTFTKLEDEDTAAIDAIRNPYWKKLRKAGHFINPLNLIKTAAGKVGGYLEERGENSRFVRDSAYVNMYGVPWATLNLLQEGEDINRRRSLQLAANFAGWWVVGSEIIDGVNHIPKAGNYLGMPFGWLGQAIDPLNPTDIDTSHMPDHLPLGPVGAAVGASMVYKGLNDARRAGGELAKVA